MTMWKTVRGTRHEGRQNVSYESLGKPRKSFSFSRRFFTWKDAEICLRVKQGRQRSAGWKDILLIPSRWQVVISCTTDEVIVGRRNESFLLSLLGKEGSVWCGLLVLYSIVCIL